MRSAVGIAVLSAAAVMSGCGSSAIGPRSHPSAAARATPSVTGPRDAHELTVRAGRASRVRVRAGVDGLVAAYGAVWVSGSGAVTRLDARTGRVVAGIRTPGVNELGYIAAGRGSVWATATGNGDVYRIDPNTNQVAATIHVGGPVVGIAVGAGQVWVSRPASALGNVVRIDPHTDRVTGDPITVGGGPLQLAYGLGTVWVQNTSPASVMRIDPANGHVTTVVGTRPVAYGSFVVGAIAIGYGSLWTAANDSLTRIDPRTDQILATVHIPRAMTVAIGDGSVWVLAQAKSRSPKLFYPIKHTAAVWQVNPVTDSALGKVLRLNAIGPAAITAPHRNLHLWIADYQSNSVTRFRLIHSILSSHSQTHSANPPATAATPAAARPLTSILGLLRRPQASSDFSPALSKQLTRESHDHLDLGFLGTPVVSLVPTCHRHSVAAADLPDPAPAAHQTADRQAPGQVAARRNAGHAPQDHLVLLLPDEQRARDPGSDRGGASLGQRQRERQQLLRRPVLVRLPRRCRQGRAMALYLDPRASTPARACALQADNRHHPRQHRGVPVSQARQPRTRDLVRTVRNDRQADRQRLIVRTPTRKLRLSVGPRERQGRTSSVMAL